MYEDLQAEHEIVMSREAMALDEAARVGQQNVELMGRVSGGQKIGYMDALRREAAATKHVSTRAIPCVMLTCVGACVNSAYVECRERPDSGPRGGEHSV
jgi:hypothetical protein